MRRLCCYLSLLIILPVFAACNTPQPNAQTDVSVSPVALLTRIPVTETSPVIPTATPTQVSAQLKNLRFSTSADITAAQPSGTIFDAGQPAMYAIVDYANWPTNTPVQIKVGPHVARSSSNDQSWTEHITGTGTLMIRLNNQSRQWLPGIYATTVQADEEALQGSFWISVADGRPGSTLFTEAFESDTGRLVQWKFSDSSGAIQSGRFQLTTAITSYVVGVSLITLVDFDTTFDIQRDPMSTDAIVGLLFRAGERGAYAFEAASDGSWSFGLSAPAVKSLIYHGKNSDAIKAGEMVNRFRVIGQGNRFTFYANDVKLGEVTEDRFNLTFGYIEPGVRSPTGKPVTAWVDNVSVELPEMLLKTKSESQ